MNSRTFLNRRPPSSDTCSTPVNCWFVRPRIQSWPTTAGFPKSRSMCCGRRGSGRGTVTIVAGLLSHKLVPGNICRALLLTRAGQFAGTAPSPNVAGQASTAISQLTPFQAASFGRGISILPGPVKFVFAQINLCIAISGVTHGPPLPVQPGPLCTDSSIPTLAASLTAWLKSACHSGVRKPMGPAGASSVTSMSTAPPMPTRLIASKSAVIPSREIFPSTQNQCTHGRADRGG